eukprot:760403-Hanusia_phi.AAC.2
MGNEQSSLTCCGRDNEMDEAYIITNARREHSDIFQARIAKQNPHMVGKGDGHELRWKNGMTSVSRSSLQSAINLLNSQDSENNDDDKSIATTPRVLSYQSTKAPILSPRSAAITLHMACRQNKSKRKSYLQTTREEEQLNDYIATVDTISSEQDESFPEIGNDLLACTLDNSSVDIGDRNELKPEVLEEQEDQVIWIPQIKALEPEVDTCLDLVKDVMRLRQERSAPNSPLAGLG